LKIRISSIYTCIKNLLFLQNWQKSFRIQVCIRPKYNTMLKLHRPNDWRPNLFFGTIFIVIMNKYVLLIGHLPMENCFNSPCLLWVVSHEKVPLTEEESVCFITKIFCMSGCCFFFRLDRYSTCIQHFPC
jgi:hypothetical protein